MRPSARPRLSAQATLLGLVLGGLLALLPGVAEGPAESGFSSSRAMAFLRSFAARPRVPGTADHRSARELILDELAGLGIEARVQEEWVALPRGPGAVTAGRVHNVVATLPAAGEAAESGKPVLLMAHYDTVPGSAGAADNGAAVAVVLEVLRNLAEGPPLAREVRAVFTDGEEFGLLGAEAFARHLDFAEVGLLLNLDARGNRGPPVLYQSSGQDLGTMRQVRRLCPGCRGFSFGSALLRVLPNTTDFSVFVDPELPGINLAWLRGIGAYHRFGDRWEHLDPAAVEELGGMVMGIVRGFATTPELPAADQRAAYLTLGPAGLWILPLSWLRLGLVAATLLLMGLTAVELRCGGSFRRGWLRAGAAVLLALPLAAVAATLGLSLKALGPPSGPPALGALALGVILAGLVVRRFSLPFRGGAEDSLVLAGLWVWLVPTVAAVSLAPAASYLFLGSLMAGLVAHGLPRTVEIPGFGVLASGGLGLVLGALWEPVLVNGVLLVPPRSLWLAALAVASLLACFLAPTLGALGSLRSWLVAAAVAGLLSLIAVLLPGSGPTEGRSRVEFREIGDGTGARAGCLPLDVPWERWLSSVPPSSGLCSGEPTPSSWPSRLKLEVLERSEFQDDREARISIAYPEAPAFLFLRLSPAEGLQAVVLGPLGYLPVRGQGAGGDAWVRLLAPPRDGLELTLEWAAGGGAPALEAVEIHPEEMAAEGASGESKRVGWYGSSAFLRLQD